MDANETELYANQRIQNEIVSRRNSSRDPVEANYRKWQSAEPFRSAFDSLLELWKSGCITSEETLRVCDRIEADNHGRSSNMGLNDPSTLGVNVEKVQVRAVAQDLLSIRKTIEVYQKITGIPDDYLARLWTCESRIGADIITIRSAKQDSTAQAR